MAVAAKDFFKIGGLIIPFAYHPQWCDGVEPAQGDGETNLLGEMTGARGGGTCRLWWNVCDELTYRWWFRDSGLIAPDQLSAPVTEVILPDPTGLGDPVEGKPHHGRFNYAVVHRIRRESGVGRQYLNSGLARRPYLIGTVEVLITMIGEVPPV